MAGQCSRGEYYYYYYFGVFHRSKPVGSPLVSEVFLFVCCAVEVEVCASCDARTTSINSISHSVLSPGLKSESSRMCRDTHILVHIKHWGVTTL